MFLFTKNITDEAEKVARELLNKNEDTGSFMLGKSNHKIMISRDFSKIVCQQYFDIDGIKFCLGREKGDTE